MMSEEYTDEQGDALPTKNPKFTLYYEYDYSLLLAHPRPSQYSHYISLCLCNTIPFQQTVLSIPSLERSAIR
jgi:hypothetical protein